MFYTEIIKKLKDQTDEVILFHSGTGKDSICLCDLMCKNFSRVVCVFMYLVPDLEFENRYIEYAKMRYPGIEFYSTSHFSIYSWIKHGHLGIKKDAKIENMTIAKIDKMVKIKFGIDWSVYGVKKNDGLNRRLMLNGYPDGLCYASQKAYPIMDLKNSEVLNYVKDNDLISPFSYTATRPSSGCDISNPLFLSYLRDRYPDDLQKIFDVFPFCEVILFKHDTYDQAAEAIRNQDHRSLAN
jgi:3'-phosphoadenosine 5'-phosphosulfate sulfotransferase (PAPS reductase)/FAD synthetase